MLRDLIKIANRLDSLGLVKEADFLDRIIKMAGEPSQIEMKNYSPDTLISGALTEKEKLVLGLCNEAASVMPIIHKLNKVVMELAQDIDNDEDLADSYGGSDDLVAAKGNPEMIMEIINQAAFERGVEPESDLINEMDFERGLNPTWYEDPRGGPKPNKSRSYKTRR